MSKRERRASKKEDSDEEEVERSGKGGKTAAKKQGYNWGAIIIMCMFVLPGLFALMLGAADWFYPALKAEREVRDRVRRCYDAANPSKVAELDQILEKYRGKEKSLFSQVYYYLLPVTYYL
ncbi:hypothetical protein B484DRAFT_390120 [Ochromonadaceae sp. CCMP2298]|nr:hypothetical protein B484DRAFT_390120 [Ochromonadaceae sp. CCMP2298]